MKRFILPVVVLCLAGCQAQKPSGVSSASAMPTVKDRYEGKFLIGTAVNMRQVNGLDPKSDSITRLHFNAVVAENCMKCEKIHPREDVYFFDDADAFVNYALERGLTVTGHTLVWHSQMAPWFAVDAEGKSVDADTFRARLKDHISTVVGRYKGKILGWDVCNEILNDDGTFRRSPYYNILGEDFVRLAFEYAHEADPEAELYLNDFNMFLPAKRDAYVALVRRLKEQGVPVTGIGMQAHVGMDYPEWEEFERSVVDFAATGCSVMITEWDMSALPTFKMTADVSDRSMWRQRMAEHRNPYPGGVLPDSVAAQWNRRMSEMIDLFERHSDVITRVTAWGTHDGMSWKNDFPIRGRRDYPLLFDRDYRLKPFLQEKIGQ